MSRQRCILTVLNFERTTEPRITPDLGPLYFAIAGWETRLSLKSPGGPPGSFGKNMPTLRRYSLYSGYFLAEMSSVNHVDAWKRIKYAIGPTADQL